MTLRDRDLKIMRAVARSNISATLDDVSARMGYRPARLGRLSVRMTLFSILRKHGPVNESAYGVSSKYVGRLPPKDQWDTERWFLTDAGALALTSASSEGGK